MTFDDNDVDYLGPLGSLSSDGCTVTTPLYNRSAYSTSPVLGGAFVVVTGSKAGQWRRIIAATGGGDGLVRRIYTLDKPIADVEQGAWVTSIPFRGRMIFTDSTYRDAGVFQLYLTSIETIVSGLKGERMGGFASWGQWSSRAYSHDNRHVDPKPFLNPNLHNQWLGNQIVEGNSAFHDERSSYFRDLRWHGCPFQLNGSVLVTIAGETDCSAWCNVSCSCASIAPPNRFNVWRHNSVHSNPGGGAAMSFLPRPGCPSGPKDFWETPLSDTVVEYTTASHTNEVLGPLPKGASGVLLRENTLVDGM
jgi:hypothetical protein